MLDLYTSHNFKQKKSINQENTLTNIEMTLNPSSNQKVNDPDYMQQTPQFIKQ